MDDDDVNLDPSCSTCEFSSPTFLDDQPEPVLECRRFPPTLLSHGDFDGLTQAWPRVGETDWCGEYRGSVAH